MNIRPALRGDSFELQVTLLDIEPPIRRRLRVPARTPLGVLHRALQVVFGWKDKHPHEFQVGDVCFGTPDPQDDNLFVDENAAPLGAIGMEGASFFYIYYLADRWELEVKVTRLLRGVDSGIKCLDGSRAAPPEDSGGAGGYQQKLDALKGPKGQQFRQAKERLGAKFDPEKFDVGPVNRELSELNRQGAGAIQPLDLGSNNNPQLDAVVAEAMKSVGPMIAALSESLLSGNIPDQFFIDEQDYHFEGSLTLKVTVNSTESPIWRRLQVSSNYTLGQLHRVLEAAFERDVEHSHRFEIGNYSYGPCNPDGTLDWTAEENLVKLGPVLKKGTRFVYWYGAVDEWEHDIKVEKAEKKPFGGVRCLAGEGAWAVEKELPRGNEPAKLNLELLNGELLELSLRISHEG